MRISSMNAITNLSKYGLHTRFIRSMNTVGARATGTALGIKSIWNSTWRTGGRPGSSSGKTSRNSLTTGMTRTDTVADCFLWLALCFCSFWLDDPTCFNISPKGFWPSILLLTVIIVTVAIVVAVVLVVVDAIIGIVVVVVVGVPSIIKLAFVITGWAYAFHQDKASSVNSSECHFVFLGTIAMRKYRFSPFKPANKANNSFCTIEVERLTAYKLFIVSLSCYKIFFWSSVLIDADAADVDLLLGGILST
nr:hypothetical protein [Tanacetum cinerariifolium]GEX42193.1 hypothetical protein [Tanacetum cinerariifolium]